MFLTVCEKLHFPAPAIQVLTNALGVLQQDPALQETGHLFVTGGDPTEILESVSVKCNIPLAVTTAVSLVQSVPALLDLYRSRNIDENICWDTLIDLTCKLQENYTVNGIWGTEAINWYQRLFSLKIIKLGRLEYEPIPYRWDTAYGHVAKDSPVLNMHIPSCGSLPMDQVIDSLKLAYQFFGGKGGENMPFVCASWMLYPPMCEAVFPKGCNLHNFYQCFDIAESYATPDNHHFWRIFDMHYDPATLSNAPTDTSLRRSLLAWIQNGNDMGIGRGAFLFDGEHISHILH